MFKKILFILFLNLLIILFIILTDKKIDNINDINKIQIYDSNLNLIYESQNNHESDYISLDDINPLMIKSLIAIEDKKFYSHYGFDIYSIFRVLLKKSKGGASTITEQYLKNLYFTNNKSYIRKLKELLYAIRLERLYSKNEIIEAYLNTIYFGDNIYGIKNAIKHYFSKDAKSINIDEIALLLTLINSPSSSNPIYNYDTALIKRNKILYKLYLNNVITKNEYQNNIKKPIKLKIENVISYSYPILYYKDLVMKEYKSLGLKKKFNNVTKIYTSFDSSLNNELYNHLKNYNHMCNFGIYILDNKGYVLSCISNNYYNQFNIVKKGIRDIGSTIKPFIYYKALENGISETKKLESKKTTFKINNKEYTIHNYNNIYPEFKIDMKYALATSDNIYAFKMYNLVGGYNVVNLLKKFNINAKDEPYLALGNIAMNLETLTILYNTLSTLGVYYNNRTIKYIKNNDKVIYKSYPEKKVILNKTITLKLTNMLTGMFDTKIKRATGLSIAQNINYKLAGKSGLTDYDSYMVGYNPLYTVGVWCGFVNNILLNDIKDKQLSKQLFCHAFNTLMENKENIWY